MADSLLDYPDMRITGDRINLLIKRKISNQFKAVILFAAVITGLVLIYTFNPVTATSIPDCPFHYFTGLFCPGCGTLRALHNILHGNFSSGFDFNPLLVILLPYITYGIISKFVNYLTGKHMFNYEISSKGSYALLIAICVYMIARNISVYPFTYLAP